MSEMHDAVWSTKVATTNISSSLKHKSQPPTLRDFTEHVYHAHYQNMTWKSFLSSVSPVVADSVQY